MTDLWNADRVFTFLAVYVESRAASCGCASSESFTVERLCWSDLAANGSVVCNLQAPHQVPVPPLILFKTSNRRIQYITAPTP